MMTDTSFPFADLAPVTNTEIAAEGRRALVTAYNRAVGWSDHPTYDTKTLVLAEIEEAIAVASACLRLLAGGSWPSDAAVSWLGIDLTRLYGLMASIKAAKHPREVAVRAYNPILARPF